MVERERPCPVCAEDRREACAYSKCPSGELAAELAEVLSALEDRFGPGPSNGVACILVHDGLPDHFDASHWADWFIKPADAAFEFARELGLIEPAGDQWRFTPLGRAAADHALKAWADPVEARHG